MKKTCHMILALAFIQFAALAVAVLAFVTIIGFVAFLVCRCFKVKKEKRLAIDKRFGIVEADMLKQFERVKKSIDTSFSKQSLNNSFLKIENFQKRFKDIKGSEELTIELHNEFRAQICMFCGV